MSRSQDHRAQANGPSLPLARTASHDGSWIQHLGRYDINESTQIVGVQVPAAGAHLPLCGTMAYVTPLLGTFGGPRSAQARERERRWTSRSDGLTTPSDGISGPSCMRTVSCTDLGDVRRRAKLGVCESTTQAMLSATRRPTVTPPGGLPYRRAFRLARWGHDREIAGDGSEARDINDLGQVVGKLHRKVASSGTKGTFTDLGILAWPHAINNHGQIVGSAGYGGIDLAYLVGRRQWQTDLMTLIPPEFAGWAEL